MIVPSIDLMGGHAVQLERGRDLKIDAGPPEPIAERFGRVGEIAVIDLDAAFGKGDNRELITSLCRKHACRVGGGIRSVEAALELLDAGAEKVILGTAATPEILSQLPMSRTMAALDAVHDEVVVDGWRTKTGASVVDRMQALAPYVCGFLVTFVEVEGTMAGLNLERAKQLKAAAGERTLTVAGGIATPDEVAQLDALGIDAQIGMALYTGTFDLADALWACLGSEREDGLVPTLVVDEHERSLGMCWSAKESLKIALDEGKGVYWSRRRGLWRKGERSGNTQKLLGVDMDCDRDVLRFTVEQTGPGFCHLLTESCFGSLKGLGTLAHRVADPVTRAVPGSYTSRLFEEPDLLAAKIREEADELVAADTRDEVIHEAADVLYFTLVRAATYGVVLSDIEAELYRRSKRVRRRKGDAKPPQHGRSQG
ncbi:MAG: phosphoribosyl-ATP diphosphatase [Myxococcales bacterium]|nr:phosphoribosyl-ATP diphosphatase [Myxococcales bacterium]